MNEQNQNLVNISLTFENFLIQSEDDYVERKPTPAPNDVSML
jgi:hypothetical protein